MRNPINSIQTLNIKQEESNKKLLNLILSIDENMRPSDLNEQLMIIHNENQETSKVQKSSSKILCFLVNDLLDYAQLKQGKFRKDCTQFDIYEAIEEIIQVQMLKAEFLEIDLYSIFEGFENTSIICIDK